MTVVALDFETATSDPASPCALGLAFVEGTEVTRRAYTLVRPPVLAFDPGNIRVHGIRSADVVDAPEFPDVWREIADELDGALVIAHNASFDLRVLAATLRHYGLAAPRLSSLCTVSLARRLWPDAPSKRLSALAERFAIRFTHHHAGEDAFACAMIALRGVAETGARDVPDLAARTALMREVSAEAPRRRGGIADRALRARGAPAGEGTLRFLVRGSAGTPYDMSLRTTNGRLRLQCSCPAARFNQACRHARAILEGDHRALLANSEDERLALSTLLHRALSPAAA